MMAAEIGQGRAVDDRARSRFEVALEDGMGVGTGDGVQGVVVDPEA